MKPTAHLIVANWMPGANAAVYYNGTCFVKNVPNVSSPPNSGLTGADAYTFH